MQSLKESEDLAISLNTDDQLGEKGIDSKGNELPKPYAPFTVDFKKAFGSGFGSITDHITLFGEGNFHKGWIMDARRFPVTFYSTDSKAGDLSKEWGKDIFGLTKQNIDELVNTEVKERFTEKYKKAVLSAFY